jgi:DNA modification methylase
MKTELVKIETLVFDPANARKHGEKNLSAIKSSLQRFGQQKPIVVDANGVVRAGNGTLAAAKALGWKEIAIVRSPLSGSEATAYAIADNRTSELAEWDDDVLSQTLAALQIEDEELALASGFDAKEIDALLAPDEVKEDEVPEPPVDPITKSGDLWILGDHRLLCGDSTKSEDVDRLMNGEKASLLQTDPPYGIAYVAGAKSKGQAISHDDIANDELDGEKLQKFLEETIKAVLPHLIDKCAFYLWHPMLTQGTFFAAAAAAADILIHRQIIWCKPSLVFGRGDYHWQHELCFYGWRKGFRPNFYGERNQTTLWHVGRETSKEHPTAKPVALWEPPFRNHTRTGDIVYEPFSGSGSQLIAAEQLGRKCYGMEISPQYCDVIVKRWENLTGKKAVLATR